jgi:hypothetical protein
MARFFISHSASAGSRAEAVLQAVRRRLDGAGHAVFVDALIKPGEVWRGRLFDELGRCDAAVVLLDQEALAPESWWVRREVYYLLWRHYLGSVHQIRGVLLDGVTPTMVRRHGYSELVDLQLLRDAPPGMDAESVAEAAVGDFGDLQSAGSDTMRRWINRVLNIIQKVEPGETLTAFAAEIGIEAAELYGVFELDRHRFLAHQLLGRPSPRNTLRAVETVEEVIGRDQTALLARHALPALIDSEAAWLLLRRDHTDDSKPRPVFVLNAALLTTSQLYVLRAGCGDRSYRHQAVSSSATGTDLVLDLEQDCVKALAKLLHIRCTHPVGDIRRRLDKYRPGDGAIVEAGFLAIEAIDATPEQMAGVAEVIRRLRSRYPWLTVIILTGPTLPETTDDWDLGDVVLLQPALSEGEEDTVDEVLVAFEEMTGGEVLTRG